MEEMDKYRLFDAYLRAELSDEEMEEFTASMESDPDLEAELEYHKSIISGIRESRKIELKEYIKSRTKRHTGFLGNNWSRPFLYASAAVLLIFVATFFVIEYYLPEEKSVTEALKRMQRQRKEEKQEKKPVQVYPETQEELINTDTNPLEENALPGETEEIELADHFEEEFSDSLKSPAPEMERSVSRVKEAIAYSDSKEEEEEQENSFPVLKDTKYADTVLIVQFISSRATGAVPDKKSRSIEADSSRFRDSTQVKKQEVNRLPSQKIQVEFWESPVDYKGYKFSGNRLLLYGFSTSQVQLKALPKNEQLNIWEYFLQSGSRVYELVEDENFRTYKEVTDQSLLQRIGK